MVQIALFLLDMMLAAHIVHFYVDMAKKVQSLPALCSNVIVISFAVTDAEANLKNIDD